MFLSVYTFLRRELSLSVSDFLCLLLLLFIWFPDSTVRVLTLAYTRTRLHKVLGRHAQWNVTPDHTLPAVRVRCNTHRPNGEPILLRYQYRRQCITDDSEINAFNILHGKQIISISENNSSVNVTLQVFQCRVLSWNIFGVTSIHTYISLSIYLFISFSVPLCCYAFSLALFVLLP